MKQSLPTDAPAGTQCGDKKTDSNSGFDKEYIVEYNWHDFLDLHLIDYMISMC